MTITTDQLTQFRALLKNEEKSAATLNKYLRDVQRFALWLGDTPLERDAMLDYKADLMRHYAAGSVNSILAALNRFLRMIAREDCRVHRLRIQYQAYSPEEREITAQEYADLVRTARETGRARLALVLQTICATGIRVSELPAITAEAARRGVAVVRCKGKSRRVLIPTRLQKKLLRYMKQHRIAFGPVFVTRSGAPLDRSNIWREMKALCRAAGVSDKKSVSPQLPPPVRPHVLPAEQGPGQAGRPAGPQQHQHHPYLHPHHQRRAPPLSRAYAPGAVNRASRPYCPPWRKRCTLTTEFDKKSPTIYNTAQGRCIHRRAVSHLLSKGGGTVCFGR